MKKFITFFCLLPLFCMAQEVTKIYPAEEPTGKNMTAVSASSYTTFTFVFPGTGFRSSYTGFCQTVIVVDSASGTVGNRNAFYASIKPTYYDVSSGTRKLCGEADQDSTTIVSNYSWGTTDDDSKVDITSATNLPPCDGAIVKIYTGANGQCKVRAFLNITYPK
jgi:hypothetical protein